MLEELTRVFDDIHFEDRDESVFLHNAVWSAETSTLTLQLHISVTDYPDIHPDWQIICSGERENRLLFGYSDGFELSSDHVLLWPHTMRTRSLFFNGGCENPHALAGDLYERHHRLVADWIPTHRFLSGNVYNGLANVLAVGFGKLAEGPEKLVVAYEEVMQQYGVSTSYIDHGPPVQWEGEGFIQQKAPLSVLIIGGSYVVAEAFEEKAV